MYVSRPRGWYDDWSGEHRTMAVIDNGPVPTGLIDKHGNPIYRTADPIRLGFESGKPR